MNTGEPTIQHVSDTALWVAHYRALESERSDSLFKDPFAKVLVGERGVKIAHSMKSAARYTQWGVVIRTIIIDTFIQELISKGVDTVINLGAGLDTRPYRMKLEKTLRWIEVDYPQMIDHKEKLLQKAQPQVKLERVSLDLANRGERKKLFSRLAADSKKVLILTEGVLPYLTEEQVGQLAEDLHEEGKFQYWIIEYISDRAYRYLKTKKRMRQMRNAPFHFFPKDWFGFFKQFKWKLMEIKYAYEVGDKSGRPMPLPWFVIFLKPFMNEKRAKEVRENMGYCILARDS